MRNVKSMFFAQQYLLSREIQYLEMRNEEHIPYGPAGTKMALRRVD